MSWKLALVSTAASMPLLVSTAPHPLFRLQSDGKSDEFEGLLKRVESETGQALEEACQQLQQLVRGLRIPQQVRDESGDTMVSP